MSRVTLKGLVKFGRIKLCFFFYKMEGSRGTYHKDGKSRGAIKQVITLVQGSGRLILNEKLRYRTQEEKFSCVTLLW